MSRKALDTINQYVGSRVRLGRMARGFSQERLGEKVGVSFQQIQKYEKGKNCIGVTRICQFAEVLSVPVSFFFPSTSVDRQSTLPFSEEMTQLNEKGPGFSDVPHAPYVTEGSRDVTDFLSSKEGLQLMRFFLQIKSHDLRKKLIELVRAIIQDPTEEEF